MTQKERDELQRYLDERIFGTKRQMRSICENKRLAQIQKDSLYQAVKDIRDIKDFTSKKITQRLDNALVVVANCLRQINFHGMKPSPNSKNSPKYVPTDKMPFLVKQVLWLICYKSLQAGLKQKDVYEELDKHNIYVSHNFFSSLEQTPDYFLKCEKYQQPENPCKYKGQKKDELAVVIKNLVYQAGKHSCFVDIFGGSGSASVAVCHKKRVKYVYNEQNTVIYNCISTLAGKDYEKVINALKLIQNDLASPDNSICPYYGFNIFNEIGEYIKYKESKGNFDEKVLGREKLIQKNAKIKFDIDKTTLNGILQEFPNEIITAGDRVEEFLRDNPHLFGGNTFQQLIHMNTVQDFYKYENGFYYLFREKIPAYTKLTYARGMKPNEEVKYGEWREILRQCKALGYFAYFYLSRIKGGILDNIRDAAGEIFLRYCSTQGDIRSSEIIYDIKEDIDQKDRNTIYDFIAEEDFASKIERFHDVLSGTITENMDFRDIIKETLQKNISQKNISQKKILFYSDSPYIGTSDYDDEKCGVSKFSEDDMKDLIKGLMQGGEISEQKDTKKVLKSSKFIFSMRAVHSVKQMNMSNKKQYREIIEANQEICQYVYKEFLSFKKPLYVLVIYKKKKNLGKLIQKSKLIEIMITNYKIVGFEVGKYICEAFTFNDYLKCIKANMVGYQKSWGL